jgi:hypothetical protein
MREAIIEPVRFGVISTAKIGIGKVIPAMQQSTHCTIAAIAARDLRRTRAAAEALGTPGGVHGGRPSAVAAGAGPGARGRIEELRVVQGSFNYMNVDPANVRATWLVPYQGVHPRHRGSDRCRGRSGR